MKMILRVLCLAATLAIGITGPLIAQNILGADCSLCKAVARGEATVAPGPSAKDILATYKRNLGAVANCLDLTLLGDPRQFKVEGRWLSDVQDALNKSLWQRSSPTGVPKDCGGSACLDNTAKLTALFRVVFGQNGLEANMLSADEKATLACTAMFYDMYGALETVEAVQ